MFLYPPVLQMVKLFGENTYNCEAQARVRQGWARDGERDGPKRSQKVPKGPRRSQKVLEGPRRS